MGDNFWKGAAAGAGLVGGLWWLDRRRVARTAPTTTAGSGALSAPKDALLLAPSKVRKSNPSPVGRVSFDAGLHPVNPRTLSELVAGHRIDWSTAKNDRLLIESALGLPWSTLTDPRAAVSLYRPTGLLERIKLTPITGGATRDVDLFFRAQSLTCKAWDHVVAKDRPAWVSLYARRARLDPLAATQLLSRANRQCAPFAGLPDGYWAPIGPMFDGAPKVTDVCQGVKGNCWFVSYLASLAWVRPDAILAQSPRARTTPHDAELDFEFVNGDTGALDRVRMDSAVPCVTLGQFDSPFSPVSITQPLCHSPTGLAWPSLFEKARAVWSYGQDRPDAFTAASLEVGSGWSPGIELLNRDDVDLVGDDGVLSVVDAQRGLDRIAPDGRARYVARAGTTDDPEAWSRLVRAQGGDLSLVCGHAYSVLGQVRRDGRTYVVLRNPWGHSPGYHPAYTLPSGTPWREGLVFDQDGVFGLDLSAFATFFAEFFYTSSNRWFPSLP